ncbi:MAG: ferrous iron transporter B [Planctomycetes bacterium]|nr:ferrous iron transporter B [Planctomycetota bacterium]
MSPLPTPQQFLRKVDAIRAQLGDRFRDQIVESLFDDAQSIARRSVTTPENRRVLFTDRLDQVLTHPIFGLPLMAVLLAAVFWLTIAGANVPSAFIAGILMEPGGLTGWCSEYLGVTAPAFLSVSLYELMHSGLAALSAPAWLSGFFIDGVYLGLAWVIAVMLPPMMIFFPIFTLLEDLGYLPRVAFNMDWLFKKAGAHGKQSLTMAMGFGCNAAGVIACRVIDSPREKLIAILTNNFVPCNGRFPTLIAIATLFVAASVSSGLVSIVAALTIMGIVFLGVIVTLVVAWCLSKTVLKGEASAFTLELPPYRRPSILRVIYTSLIDRTIFVLIRACIVAAPAGAVIWLLGNISVGEVTLAVHVSEFLNPFGWILGLDGVILLAYIIAIPANEIVMPTIIMLYLQHNMMIEKDGPILAGILQDHGWTMMTAVCLMIFCLLHNPCGTTIWTMWKETRNVRWTVFGALMPLIIGFIVCATVAGVWRLLS